MVKERMNAPDRTGNIFLAELLIKRNSSKSLKTQEQIQNLIDRIQLDRNLYTEQIYPLIFKMNGWEYVGANQSRTKPGVVYNFNYEQKDNTILDFVDLILDVTSPRALIKRGIKKLKE